MEDSGNPEGQGANIDLVPMSDLDYDFAFQATFNGATNQPLSSFEPTGLGQSSSAGLWGVEGYALADFFVGGEGALG